MPPSCFAWVSPLSLWQVRSLHQVKRLVEGITKIRLALSYHLVHPYFGNALNPGLYPTLYTIQEKKIHNSERGRILCLLPSHSLCFVFLAKFSQKRKFKNAVDFQLKEFKKRKGNRKMARFLYMFQVGSQKM